MITIAAPAPPPGGAGEPTFTLGTDVRTGLPVKIPRSLLHGSHMHTVGRTRCGKSSTTLLPLAVQSADPYTVNGVTYRDSVLFIDQGGDQAMLHIIRAICLSQVPQRTFRFLSLDPDDDWDVLDPFQSLKPESRSVTAIVNLLIEAFSLDNGLMYGGSYFTAANLAALLKVCRQLVRPGLPPPTLQQVSEYLEKNRRKVKDADQVRMTIAFLTEFDQLKREKRADPTREINMARLLDNGEVAYIFAPTLGNTTSARQFAGLALYSLVHAAMERAHQGLPMKRCLVFIDEFQELAGRSFAALLAQAAKFGITFILSNQSTSQLDNRDNSLASIVFDNTAIKWYHTVSSKRDVEELQFLSGEHETDLHGESFTTLASGVSNQGMFRPRLDVNEILEVSGTFGQGFVFIDDGLGWKPPIRVQGHFATTKEVYERNSRLPLPKRPKAPTPTPVLQRAMSDPELNAKLTSLLQQKVNSERI